MNPEPIIYVLIGLLVVLFLEAIVVGYLWLKTGRAIDAIIGYLGNIFEPALYKAASEMSKKGVWTASSDDWTRHWYFITNLRLHLIPKVRRRLEGLFQHVESKFQGAVEVKVNWQSDYICLDTRPWKVSLYNADGMSVWTITNLKPPDVHNEFFLQTLFKRDCDAVKLVLFSPNGDTTAFTIEEIIQKVGSVTA